MEQFKGAMMLKLQERVTLLFRITTSQNEASCRYSFITTFPIPINPNGNLVTINMTKGEWEHFCNSLYNQVYLLLCTMGSAHFSQASLTILYQMSRGMLINSCFFTDKPPPSEQVSIPSRVPPCVALRMRQLQMPPLGSI